jgi:hypothetical protein
VEVGGTLPGLIGRELPHIEVHYEKGYLLSAGIASHIQLQGRTVTHISFISALHCAVVTLLLRSAPRLPLPGSNVKSLAKAALPSSKT